MASRCPHCGSTDIPGHDCEGLALIGQVLDGRYEIKDVLGYGGMGTVFRALQTSVNRQVAVKTLHPSLANAPTFFERFRREAEIASQLRHPHIITVFDFGRTQSGTCYYVMELLPGESLKQLVKREGPLSLRRAAGMIQQVAKGLSHAHAHDCVHRDLKPHNIMLQPLHGQDFITVLDFGLVKALRQANGVALTSAGQVLGTPQYMAPEQASGDPVDHRADLYSLGGVLYYSLTGSSPFGAKSVRKALIAAMTQTVAPVASRRIGAPVPDAMDAFFRKALALDRNERFESADAFMAALQSALAGLTDAELDALPTGVREPAPELVPPPAQKQPSMATVLVDPDILAEADEEDFQAVEDAAALPTDVRPPPGVAHRRRQIAAAAASACLVFAGAAAFHFWHPSERTAPVPRASSLPTPVEASSPPAITVDVRSQPQGASIYDGEVELGRAPVELRLARGELHRLTFRLEGHRPVERALDYRAVTGSEVQLVEVTLPPAEPSLSPVRRARPRPQMPIFE